MTIIGDKTMTVKIDSISNGFIYHTPMGSTFFYATIEDILKRIKQDMEIEL